MSDSNQIQTLQFQLEIPSAAHNKNIQNKVVDMFNYALQPMLDRLLSSFSVADTDIGFESIEITLDPIPLDMLQDELLAKTEAALKDYFAIAFKELQHSENVTTTPAPESKAGIKQLYSVTKTATLTYFLTYGHYPWWEKELNTTLSQRWMEALKKEKKQFTTQLAVLGKKRYVLKRMAYQLANDALRNTVTAIEPGASENIFAFHEHLKEQQQKKPISTGVSSNDFSKTIWEFTLIHLFIEMGTVFNQKMFLKSQVKQIAQHYNTTYKTVLAFLNKGLEQLAENDVKKRKVFLTLKELEQERILEEKPKKIIPPDEDLILSLKTILKKIIYTKKDKTKIAQYIAQITKSQYHRKQAVKQLTSEEFQRLIAFIVPREKAFINEYLLKTTDSYKEKPTVSVSQSDFIKSVREIVLTYLLVENTTVFNRKMFLKTQISQIASHYNISSNEVLQFLTYGFREVQTSNWDNTAFSGILKLLLDESNITKEETIADATSSHQDKSRLELLQPLLSLQTLSVKEYALFLSILENYWKKQTPESIALPDKALLKILYHLHPEHHLYIQKYLENITPLHSGVFAVASASAFKDRAWYFAIEALVTKRHSQFNTKVFIEQQLKKLALHFNVEYIAILFHFMEIVDASSKDTTTHLLKDTLETLYLEHHVTPSVFKKIVAHTDFSTYISQVVYFLQFGSYPPDSPQINKPILEQVFRELLLNYKEKLLATLKKHGLLHQQNEQLPGLKFFSKTIITAWEKFKKASFYSDTTTKKHKETPAITDAQYKNILAFYLKTGALPWWAGAVTIKEVITYLLAKPEAFYAFVKSQQWTMPVVQRINALFTINESETFLHIILEKRYVKMGAAINSALGHITNYINYTKLNDAFLLFALQHIKQSFPPKQFMKLYMEQFCYENGLNYSSCIIKSAAYLENQANSNINIFIEEEKNTLALKDYDYKRKKIVQLYTRNKDREAFEKLSEFIKKQDKNTAIQLLSDLATPGKKMVTMAVFRIFLEHLHKKDHAVITFFTEMEQLKKIIAIRDAFPGLYNDVLHFYINYIGIKKITAFNFNEFMMHWFAYMEQKDKAKSIKLMHLLKKHPKKDSPWLAEFILYFSEPLSAEEDRENKIPIKKPPPIDKMETLKDKLADDVLTEKILTFNSGLVLLWPFLTHCFKALNYTSENKFINPGLQERAIYLLHYIATGFYEDIGEEQLVVNKILCGFPVTQPLSSSIIPTQQEKDLVESMLKAVIARWSKLGNTSIDGLRGSYITREGYLEEHENGRQITIEKKGYDILLDYLPWKLGLIKLPWMDKPLYVLWRQQ